MEVVRSSAGTNGGHISRETFFHTTPSQLFLRQEGRGGLKKKRITYAKAKATNAPTTTTKSRMFHRSRK